MTDTSAPVRFDDIPLEEPDLDALEGQARALKAKIDEGGGPQGCRAELEAWNESRERVSTYAHLVDLRFEQDTADGARKAAKDAWDEQAPRWTELQVDVQRHLLGHEERSAFEADIGAQAFALWESQALAFDAAIKEDLVKESKLVSQYTELLASAELEFNGESHNLSTIGKYASRAERDLRHDSSAVVWDWFAKNGEELDRNFDELVSLRGRMAKTLGFPSFTELGYKRMCRVDYGQQDVERFRAEIIAEVVPLCLQIRERQAQVLGVDPLMVWDEPVHDVRGNPEPRGDRAWMVERAEEMFDAMGGGLGEFFERMVRGEFLDLDSRQGKAGGGFCTSFPSHGMPFVFANFNGTQGDVRVLTHEVGHAFQNYSSQGQDLLDYHWPTAESAEVHSMSLEFLTYPWMDAFFGDEGERFRWVHMADALLFLPYGTAVDHFQHLVYERPDCSPAERHEMWREMERTYLPWRDWGDLGYGAKGGRWQRQSHIYFEPFYYIDYVLAQACALQYWAWAERDRGEAMESYVRLCARGGSAPFQELVRGAEITSPFQAGCLKDVVERARGFLLG